MEEAKRAFDGEAWNLVVRRSQEVVELSLKGLLKLMGVESPKTHDVGDTFAKICTEKRIAIESGKLAEIQRISPSVGAGSCPSVLYGEGIYARTGNPSLAVCRNGINRSPSIKSEAHGGQLAMNFSEIDSRSTQSVKAAVFERAGKLSVQE